MSLEPQSFSAETLGSLQSCLVGGDPAQRSRERKVRRRALTISVTLQSALVAALVLVPLFAKPPIISMDRAPVPIYQQASSPSDSTPKTHGGFGRACVVCIDLSHPAPLTPEGRSEPAQPEGPGFLTDGPPTGPCPNCIPIANSEGPRPPVANDTHPDKKRLVQTHIDPAMLIHRVEPIYPILPKQLGRSGRVELHAIIATDGTIQSLQAVSGDPLFFRSALDAVQQWRYRPTVLNGQPVEIDTFITVIYNIAR